ncbi:MAG: hypothetical protein LQ339_005898 [Xanthoria mediterranea]|nr:MAG: hypothetical protein LQ339_005898 [Xanthoria mediterranea]
MTTYPRNLQKLHSLLSLPTPTTLSQLSLLPDPLNPTHTLPSPKCLSSTTTTAPQPANPTNTANTSSTSSTTSPRAENPNPPTSPAAGAPAAPQPFAPAGPACAVCRTSLASDSASDFPSAAGSEPEKFNFPRTSPQKQQVPLPPPPWTDHPNGITLLHPPLCHHCTSNLDFLASASASLPPPPPPLSSHHNNNKPPSNPPKWISALPSNRLANTPSPPPPPTPNPNPSVSPTPPPPLRKKPSLLSTLTSKLRTRASSAQLHTPVAASIVKGSSASGVGGGKREEMGGWWGGYGYSDRNNRGKGARYEEEEEKASMEMVEMR